QDERRYLEQEDERTPPPGGRSLGDLLCLHASTLYQLAAAPAVETVRPRSYVRVVSRPGRAEGTSIGGTPRKSIHFAKQPQRSWLLPAAISSPISALVGLLIGYVLFRRGRPKAAVSAAGKRVDQAMTRDPRSIAPLTPVSDAARLMRSENVGSVPVVENCRLVGIGTDRDIAPRIVGECPAPA